MTLVNKIDPREKHAWESFEQATMFYHVTPYHDENAEQKLVSIFLGGLKAFPFEDEEAAIWFFTDKDWAVTVAEGLGMWRFALFGIRKKGIKRERVRWDDVADYASAVSFYTMQERISRSHIKFLGIYEIKPRSIDEILASLPQ